MSKEEQYKQLCEDLLRYVTKDGFEFVKRFQTISSGVTPSSAPLPEQPAPPKPTAQQKTPPLPGAGSAASFDVSGVIKRTNDLVNKPAEVGEDDEIPF